MRAWRGVLRAGMVGVAVMVLSGCYTYRVVDNPPIGSMVRVNVPVTTTSALTAGGSSTESIAVDGVLLAVGDTLSVATQTRRSMGAYRELVQFDTLRLAAGQATSVELKEFSSSRSVVLGVVIAAAAGTAGAVAFGLGGGQSGNEPPGPIGPSTAVVTSSLVSTVWGLLRR